MPLTSALSCLHRTARLYKDDATLIDPTTGREYPALVPRTAGENPALVSRAAA